MKYILDMLRKQQNVVEGEEVEINGEVYKLGALTEEEKQELIQEGKKLANELHTINGKEVKLLDIKSGKKLFQITEVLNLEGNFTGLWYVWRQRKIELEFNKKSEKAQKDLKKILAEEGLDKYLEL